MQDDDNRKDIMPEPLPQSLTRLETAPLRDQEILDVAPEEAPHLLDYLQVILKRRWTVLLCFVIVFATVAIGTFKEKKVYEGTDLIEITPEQPNVLNFQEILRIDNQDPDAYRRTQYKILQSRTLAERVVRDLKLYLYPEFYRSRSFLGLIVTNPKHIPLPSDPNPPASSSTAFGNAVGYLQNNLEVSPVRESNLVNVSFYSHDPQLAALVANDLAQDYIQENLEVKWNETTQASHWLGGKLVKLQAKLETSEDALQNYAQQNSILFITSQENLVNTTLAQLQKQYTDAQADRFKYESEYSLIRAGKIQDLPGFLDNQMIQNLSESLADLQRQYAQLTTAVKPSYPTAVALKKQMDTVQRNLDRAKAALTQNIVQKYQAARANEKYLAQALQQQKAVVNAIAQKSIQYNILKQKVDTNNQLYQSLLQRMKEAQIQSTLTSSNIRVVDGAQISKRPVRPRVLLNLALGVILGLGMGVGLAFFQEYMDDTLKTPDDVESLLRLPSLGVVPSFLLNGAGKAGAKSNSITVAERSHLPPVIQTNQAALEAYRSLRTSILLSASPVPKVLLVTSPLPSEGKTTTVINLGATLASLGSRVVILDCDMRRPNCHRSLKIPNKPGFVSCLTGRASLEQATVPVPGVPNLFVIPCGPIPPNPAEILSSPAAGELLRQLRSDFDYVLVDSPPVLSVTDGRILATLTDAVVLVVRAYRTPYDVVRRARSLLYGAGARILGVALNDVNIHRDGYYGYKYSYYYRYGYGDGYGYSNEEAEAAESEPKDASRSVDA
jgi:succinoglycan biosynthesis transport protein ExoP